MSFYENIFIARQDLSPSQVDALVENYKNLVKNQKGEVKDHEYWGLRTLAYPIRRNRRGHYVLLKIKAPAKTISALRHDMNLNEDVLKSLSVRVEKLEEGPSIMMQTKRDDE
ncbi:MAG: 30S ribosomal protein S6 [Holosporaceae bacterium]|nr:MAG: 30S ribosomal protein S6 [Holosporaceae bacterium]